MEKCVLIVEFLNFGLAKLVEACKSEDIKPVLFTTNKVRYAHEYSTVKHDDLVLYEFNLFDTYLVDKNVLALQCVYIITGIISNTDTFSSVAIGISDKFDLYLPNKNTISICRQKDIVRKKLFEKGLENIKSTLLQKNKLDEFNFDNIVFPIIIKDSSGTGSQNIYKAENINEAIKIFSLIKEKKLLGEVLIEDYIYGTLYSAEIIVCQGVPKFLGFSGRILSDEPYFREEIVSFPIHVGLSKDSLVKDHLSKAIKYIGFENGFAHIEFIVTENNINIVEINPRLGGIMLGLCFCEYFNFNVYSALLHFSLNKVPVFFTEFERMEINIIGTAQKLIYASNIGVFKGILHPEIKEGYKLIYTMHIGDKVTDLTSQNSCVGVAKNCSGTTEEALYNIYSFCNKVKVIVE